MTKQARTYRVTLRRVVTQEQTVVVSATTLWNARHLARKAANELSEEVKGHTYGWRIVRAVKEG